MYLDETDLPAINRIANQNRAILDIVQEVSAATGLTQAQITGRSLTPRHVQARDLVCFIARRHGISSKELGRALHRDHSGILDAIKREAARRDE